MRKLGVMGWAAAVAMVVASGAASAQEGASWGGLYVQGFIGDAAGQARQDLTNGRTTGDHSGNQVSGGAGLGYGLQVGRLLVGVEGDIASGSGDITAHNPSPDYNYTTHNGWLATGVVRAGYDLGLGFLPYALGGVAAGDVRLHTYRTDGPGSSIDFSHTQAGWTLGAGAEVPLPLDAFRLKVEYRYVDLGKTDGTGSLGNAVSGTMRQNQVRLALAFRI
ncbi:outer membrane protein [Nitrospirillum iridis]|uniref:Opacity protein-like surface antigen n=1 Tax=Nitrospirillum iridis TaxID=765888 RepID=A0A7X0B3I1_9PROT|nr:outer membrane beta-barrel protein [Nitrospirillum iridis]MBB6253569.1 opacity protein-like surface antigen [Nitrospirillum iridis]